MQKIILTTAFCILCSICIGQYTTTPNYLSSPSIYNPAALGALQEEGFSISQYSNKTITNGSSRILPFERLIDPTRFDYYYYRPTNKIASIVDSKNISFVGYHKSWNLSEKTKFTLGGQAQLRKENAIALTTPQTFGFTANIHFLLRPKRNKVRYFSNGIQFAKNHYTPNQGVVETLYEQLSLKPSTSAELGKEISGWGNSLSYNMSFHSHLIGKKAFTLGLNLSTTSNKIIDTYNSSRDFGLEYSVERNFNHKYFVNFQRVVNQHFSVEFFGTFGDFSSGFFGTGFRVNEKTVFRLYTGIFTDYSEGYFMLQSNFERPKYTISAQVGYNWDNTNIAQLSCAYNLGGTNNMTLLRLY